MRQHPSKVVKEQSDDLLYFPDPLRKVPFIPPTRPITKDMGCDELRYAGI